MNKTNVTRYVPQARKDFIAAVTAQAQLLIYGKFGDLLAEVKAVTGGAADE